MKKVFIFDMDDTTVDSSKRFDLGLFPLLQKEGIAFDRDELIAVTIPIGITGTARLYQKMGVAGTAEEIQTRIEDCMATYYENSVVCKAGSYELLRRLHDEGHRLFTLTATSHVLADACLKKNRLYDLFEKVWATDDFGLQKHDVALFQEVARTLDVTPDCIYYFDDSLTAIETARAAGFHTYGVFNGQSQEEIEYIKTHHDGFVTDFSELSV